MRYVIIDLEWNNVYVKRLNGFINEIIEVGAVMLDDSLAIQDAFSCLVKSQLGRKLNSHVKQLTHLSNEELNGAGISFSRAMEQFSAWLGTWDDIIFLSWGSCDLRSLLDNFQFFLKENAIPFVTQYIDLQNYCQGIVASGTTNQVGLAAAAEKIGIDVEQYNNHRALDDSLLAAECLRRTYDSDKISRYTEVCDHAFFRRLKFKTVPITDINDPKVDKGLMCCHCDRCGEDMELFSDWVSANNSFRSIFVCRHCKLYKRCTIKFIELNGGMDVKISYRTAHELTEANNEPSKTGV